jgi:hypothetical protein
MPPTKAEKIAFLHGAGRYSGALKSKAGMARTERIFKRAAREWGLDGMTHEELVADSDRWDVELLKIMKLIEQEPG